MMVDYFVRVNCFTEYLQSGMPFVFSLFVNKDPYYASEGPGALYFTFDFST